MRDDQTNPRPIDWESFYRDYRKPGYIPGYEIQTQLGSGAFGIVFKAVKESIGKAYAIKFLKIDDLSTKVAVQRELDTVRLFAQIDHPHLVSIEDQGEVDGIPFIVMAFAGEETLRHRLDAQPMSRSHAMTIFVQICRGVAALHDHSLVHFDLKPANVYLRDDVARVGDYGLSKLITESHNSLSMGRGTPYYMAPELLRRRGDARSDIYALGVMLFEMLCGEPPFRGDSEWEILRKHESESPQIPESVGEPERSVIVRALAKDPAARYACVHDLLAALRGESVPPAGVSALGDPDHDASELPRADVDPVATTFVATDDTRSPRPRRRSALSMGCGVLLLLGGFFVLVALWTLGASPTPMVEFPSQSDGAGAGADSPSSDRSTTSQPDRHEFTNLLDRLPEAARDDVREALDQVRTTLSDAKWLRQLVERDPDVVDRLIAMLEHQSANDPVAAAWVATLRDARTAATQRR